MSYDIPSRTEPKEDTAPPKRVHEVKVLDKGKGAAGALAYHGGMSRKARHQAEYDKAAARLAKMEVVGARRYLYALPFHSRQVYLLAEEQGQNRERVLSGFNVSPAFRASFLTDDQHESAEATGQQAAGA